MKWKLIHIWWVLVTPQLKYYGMILINTAHPYSIVIYIHYHEKVYTYSSFFNLRMQCLRIIALLEMVHCFLLVRIHRRHDILY